MTENRLTLVPGRLYAMEVFGPEFGEDIRRCSPIEVRSVTASGTGGRLYELAYHDFSSPAGERDQVYTVQTIKRSTHFIMVRVIGLDRLILLTELTDDWLRQHFALPQRDDYGRDRAPVAAYSQEIAACFAASEPDEFFEFHYKADVLAQHGLPDIGYPVPKVGLNPILEGLIEPGFAELLYWLQQYTEHGAVPWRSYSSAMERLAALLLPAECPPVEDVAGADFWLRLGHVDLQSSDIVTIQRDDELLAAFSPINNGKLCFSAFQPLDAKAIRYALGLSRLPAADGSVCMRPSNWEYALDCAAGMGNVYSSMDSFAYLSRWQCGLGISANGDHVDVWYAQRDRMPMDGRLVAMQLDLHVAMKPDEGA